MGGQDDRRRFRYVLQYSWRGLAVACLVIGLLLCFGWLGYGAGRERGQAMQPERALELVTLRRHKREADRLIADLSQELVALKQAARIDRDAARQVRSSVLAMDRELEAQREEIAFYRSLMAPAPNEQGLGIYSLELHRMDEPKRYRFEVVLRQRSAKHRLLRGRLELSVIGRVRDAVVELPLEKLSPPAAEGTLGFSFKYFEKLQGELQLPEDFLPETVAVAARTWSRPVTTTERDFAWLVHEE